MTDYDEFFGQAKKQSTLERMLMAKVRDMRLLFDPSCQSLKVVANSYKNLGNMHAYRMLMAAYRREQELDNPALSKKKTVTTPPKISNAELQSTLEKELSQWMSKSQRVSA